MLCCYVGQFLIFLCPVSFAPACNFVWPHVEEVIADIEGMWRKVRDDFPETLGRQETSPDKSEIVEVAEDAAGEGSPSFSDAIVEPVNVACAKHEIVVLRELY